jgi:hypothetical protein
MRAFYSSSCSSGRQATNQLRPSSSAHGSHHHHRTPTLHQASLLPSFLCWSTVASPTMHLLTPVRTAVAPHAFPHQLEHRHCLFINFGSRRTTAALPQQQLLQSHNRLTVNITMHKLCIKLATSNPSRIGPPLPLQPCAFSHRRLQRRHHMPSIISLNIVIASSSTPVPQNYDCLTSTTAPTEPPHLTGQLSTV